ncbi:MAG: ABC transporter ATP-binding protein [Spirochaetia bacterium]|jgi:iron(III) transport system ATP-binding protein|nr:ABC transporter ATP-binding protein [Spirochaetia bacterium]
MKEGYLTLENLTKTFGNGNNLFTAVDHVNLQVKEGELVTLLGPSGCGKTTTLRMIAGFHVPSSGKVLIDSLDMSSVPPNKRPTAMVFQNYALFPHMTVKKNISYGLEIMKLPKQTIENKTHEIIQMIGLSGLEDRQPRQLSGGQQQRVSLARAMVMEPKVLLFDEPLSNLDAKLRVSTRLEIRHLQQRVGITSVYVTHDQEEAMTISDRIVIMSQGKIQQVDTPQEIYAHPTNRFVADFIGKVNFLDGTVTGIEDNQLIISCRDKQIAAPYFNKSIKQNDRVLLTIRPESIELCKPEEGIVEARVSNAIYFGSQVIYNLNLDDGQELNAEVADPQFHPIFAQGSKVSLKFKNASLHVLPYEEL